MDINTPINTDELERLLKLTKYNKEETEFLIDGFRHGFSLGYQGPQKRKDLSDNIPITVGSKVDLWNKVMKEVSLGRFAGPYTRPPFKYFVQSPIGLVPKAGGQTRLIFHLCVFANGNLSINDWTPEHLCSVKYRDLDHAITNSLKLLENNNTALLFYGKTDLKSAFRVAPILPRHRKFLILQCRNPITKTWEFFAEKNLPFGSSISCCHFQRLSDGLHHIVEKLSGSSFAVTNYLDDFLFIQTSRQACNQMVRLFLDICQQINFPVSHEKTCWASNIVVFLGIVLDGKRLCTAIPEDKLIKALNMVSNMIHRKKATVKEIQRLAGMLNFLNKAIHPGRAFTRRMYSKYSDIADGKTVLKHYHHVKVDKEFRNDCEVWRTFLLNQEAYSRPFIDVKRNTFTAVKLRFYTDASKHSSKGFGCVFGNRYTFGIWEKDYIKKFNPSIAYLELLALCIGIFTWQEKLSNMRIEVLCDNNSAKSMVNNLSTGGKNCMYLVRLLTLNNLLHNRRVFVKFISTKKNTLADALSRLQFKRFFKHRGPNMRRHPSPLPNELWPASKIWQN